MSIENMLFSLAIFYKYNPNARVSAWTDIIMVEITVTDKNDIKAIMELGWYLESNFWVYYM